MIRLYFSYRFVSDVNWIIIGLSLFKGTYSHAKGTYSHATVDLKVYACVIRKRLDKFMNPKMRDSVAEYGIKKTSRYPRMCRKSAQSPINLFNVGKDSLWHWWEQI